MERVIALGFFDGVHLGHAALLRRTVQRARELAIAPCALTLDRPPAAALGRQPVSLVCTLAQRARQMRALGIAEVLIAPFDDALMHTEWETFLSRELVGRYGARHLVCGESYRFGAGGAGSAQRLRDWCAGNGIGCDVVGKVCMDGEPVSSTRLRACIVQGDMQQAARLLGRPYEIEGVVTDGRHLGRTLGIPTANIPIPDGLAVPAHGVYAARVRTDAGEFSAVANVGTRPTVGGTQLRVEAWLLDFSGDLYRQSIRVALLAHLRPERKFASVDALRRQILADADAVRAFFRP